jgi:hypothetical protein
MYRWKVIKDGGVAIHQSSSSSKQQLIEYPYRGGFSLNLFKVDSFIK